MILVTGGTGFLGHSLLPLLRAHDYPVRVLTRQPEAHPWLRELSANVVQADITHPDAVRLAAQNTEAIIHAAGLFRFMAARDEFEATNSQGTENVLRAAVEVGVRRVVLVSTIAVAGWPTDPTQAIDEDTPPRPWDDYQRTKLAAEQRALAYARDERLEVVIVRGGAFYGPHGRYAFNKLFFEDPLINRLPMGVDGGRHITFPAYIKDVAQGVLLALEKGQSGEIYNIASQSLAHREVERTIAHLAGTSSWRLHAPSRLMIPVARMLTQFSKLRGQETLYVANMQPYILGEWNVSIEKARRALGYEPTPFEQGVRETLQWYAETGLWKPKKGYNA
ncbi:MAG: NAD-dependent epimerase/dehydratase family protein [Anaerolineales bacterium]